MKNRLDTIYIQPNAHDRWFEGNKPNNNFVEYIRKDTFIEKLETWLNKRHKHDRYTLIYFRKHFKNIINEIMDD